MKKNNAKLKRENGITLISLILTIVIMLIIAGISVNTGMESLKKTELQGFYMRLDIVQKKIDQIAATDTSYNSLGSSLTSEQINNLNSILSNEGSGLELNVSTFRYFTTEQLESMWGLDDIKYNVFVDFKTRTVVAEEGLTIDNRTYHILPKTVYNVEIDNYKNEKWAVGSLSFFIGPYGKTYYPSVEKVNYDTIDTISNSIVYNEKENYIITVIPHNNAGQEMKGGTLKYKKKDSTSWKMANGLEFIISIDSNDKIQYYDVIFEDNNQNECKLGSKIYMQNGNAYIEPYINN